MTIPMTVVGTPVCTRSAPITLRTRHKHYAQAVSQLIDEAADDFIEDGDEECQDARLHAVDEALRGFATIQVYAGHPPDGTSDCSRLTLIHEE